MINDVKRAREIISVILLCIIFFCVGLLVGLNSNTQEVAGVVEVMKDYELAMEVREVKND